jgi:hypothetical protein
MESGSEILKVEHGFAMTVAAAVEADNLSARLPVRLR